MLLREFFIGYTFWTRAGAFRCTDIGTRVVVAVPLGPREADNPSWVSGPPYAVEEVVFDEDDLEGCWRSEVWRLLDKEENP